MSFMSRHFLAGLGLSLTVLILAVSLSADDANPAPTPDGVSTAESTAVVVDVITTPEIVITPDASPVIVTTEPTIEIPVETVTVAATLEPIVGTDIPPVMTESPVTTLPPEPAMALLVRELFDNGDLSPWSLGSGWVVATQEANVALQSINSNTPAVLLKGDFINVAVQARLRLQGGAVRLSVRQSSAGSYSAVLHSNGQLDLYRGLVLMNSTLIAPVKDEWVNLRLSAVDGVVRIGVNDREILTVEDTAPLPTGQVGIAGEFNVIEDAVQAAEHVLWVDDFFVYVKADELSLYPAPTPFTGVVPVIPIVTLPPTQVPIVVTLQPEVTDAPSEATDLPPEVTEASNETTDVPPEVTDAPTEATDLLPELTDIPSEATDLPPQVTDVPSGSALIKPMSSSALEALAIPGASPAVNDDFVNATNANFIPYSDTTLTSGIAIDAEVQESTPSCGFKLTKTIWYKFTPTNSGKYLFTTIGSNFDTVLAVYVGSSIDALTETACNDDAKATDLTSNLILPLTAGITYRIQLGGYNGLSGSAVFTIKYANLPLIAAPTGFPASSNPTNTLQPYLGWNAVPGAALYELELNTKPLFNGIMLFTGKSSAPSQIPSSSLSTGVFYWRVRSLNINLDPGPWSVTKTLTINTSTPVITAPVAGAALTTLRPQFTWKAYPGASHYQFVIARDALMNDVIIEPVLGAGTSYLYPEPLLQGVYYWQLKAQDANGNWGAYSEPRQLTLNIATKFKDIDISLLTKPTFTWAPVPGATGYRLEIFADQTLMTPVPQSPFPIPGTGLTTTYTLTAPIANGDSGYGEFYWRINANVGDFPELPDTLFRKLIISPANPGTPKISPTNPAPTTNDSGPVIAWTPAIGTAGQPFTYEIQISTTAAFNNLLVASLTGLTGTSYDFLDNTLPAQGIYYARMRSVNKYGVTSLWSGSSSLTPISKITVNTIPPLLKSPAVNSTVTTLTPSFTWGAYPGATGYELELSRSSSMSPLLSSTPLGPVLTYVYPDELTQGIYYWRVKAKDASGHLGQFSAPSMFMVNIAISPADNSVVSTIPTTFSWKPVTGVESYRLEIFTDAGMTIAAPGLPMMITSTSPISSVDLSAIANGQGGYGVFYWRINAKMPSESFPTLPSTFSRKLTISPPAPGIPKFLTTTPAAVTNDSGPVITWTAPAGTAGLPFTYDLQLSTVNTFPTQVVNLTGLSSLTKDLSDNTLVTAGIYYARVRAVNKHGVAGNWTPAVSATTPVRSFRFDPLPPKLLAPAANSSSPNHRPTFTWAPYPGAKEYKVYIFDEDMEDVGSEVVTVPTYSYDGPEPLPQGIYYWQVSAQDANGHDGVLSPLSMFAVNIALLPKENEITTDTTPTFTWTAVPGAEEYRLEIYMELDPGNGSFIGGTIMSIAFPADAPTTYTLPTPLPQPYRPMGIYGYFKWRVHAKMPFEEYPTLSDGLFRRLTINYGSPAMPTMTSPTAFINQSGPIVTWTEPSVTDYYMKHEIEISKSSTFIPLLSAISVNEVNALFPDGTAVFPDGTLPTEGLYYIRLRAVNMLGVASKWTNRSFTYDATLPTIPVLTMPPDNSSVITTQPVFSWGAVKGAVRYELQLTADLPPDEPPLSPMINVVGASYTPPGALIATTYYWRVRAADAANNLSDWSLPRQIKVVTSLTGVPQLNRFVSTPTLSWTPISWVVSDGYYWVQIDNDPKFLTLDYDQKLSAGIYSVEVPLVTSLIDGTWYWRVLACPPTTSKALNCVASRTGSFVIDR